MLRQLYMKKTIYKNFYYSKKVDFYFISRFNTTYAINSKLGML